MFVTRDDVVSQRLGFGRWNFFIGVTNGHVFFNFPVSRALGTRLKGRPEKLCDFIGCNFKSRASQKYRVVVISFCRHACRVNIALTVIKT